MVAIRRTPDPSVGTAALWAAEKTCLVSGMFGRCSEDEAGDSGVHDVRLLDRVSSIEE